MGGFAGFAGTATAGFAGGIPCGDCDDDDVCTDDVCELIGMCTHHFNTAACDDGDACTVNEHCAMGKCLPGEPRNCDDGNACTVDICEPGVGCNDQPSGIGEDGTLRAIPDSQLDCGPPEKSAVSTVELEGVGDVVWLQAEVSLQHEWAGDLTVQLEHDGTVVRLFDRFPGDGSLSSDFDGTYVFAATGLPFEKLGADAKIPDGTYASLDSLDVFTGKAAEGAWTLTVSDGCHDDKGSMNGWILRVGAACMGADTMCSGACNLGVCECSASP